MISFRPTIVIFACPECRQTYRATQERCLKERPGRFDCIDCNAEVHSWRGTFDYAGWQATSPDNFAE
jgi:hypothetical protein